MSNDKFLQITTLADDNDTNSSNGTNVTDSDLDSTDSYNSTFDIPVSEQNYTDAHNKTHPIWAKNLFTKEYKSFDELFVPWEDGQNAPLSSE